MSDPQGAMDAEHRPYELAVERYLVDRLTALLRDPPRMSEQDIRARALDVAGRKFGTEEYAGKGFPRVQDGSTDTVGTPDPQRYWWQHGGCDSAPIPGAADWPSGPCTGCGMSLGGWTRGAPIAAGSVPSLPEETPDAR